MIIDQASVMITSASLPGTSHSSGCCLISGARNLCLIVIVPCDPVNSASAKYKLQSMKCSGNFLRFMESIFVDSSRVGIPPKRRKFGAVFKHSEGYTGEMRRFGDGVKVKTRLKFCVEPLRRKSSGSVLCAHRKGCVRSRCVFFRRDEDGV